MWGLAVLSILIFLWVGNTHSKLYSPVQLPGASLASVEVSLTDFKNWLQKTENVSEGMVNLWGAYAGVLPQTVFIELLSQLKMFQDFRQNFHMPSMSE